MGRKTASNSRCVLEGPSIRGRVGSKRLLTPPCDEGVRTKASVSKQTWGSRHSQLAGCLALLRDTNILTLSGYSTWPLIVVFLEIRAMECSGRATL